MTLSILGWMFTRQRSLDCALSVFRESIPDSSRIMTGWFSRRSGSRVSIHNPLRRALRVPSRVFRETLCPLGQPEKAIGEKSQIELALHKPLCLSASGTEGRRSDSSMNGPQRTGHDYFEIESRTTVCA